MDTDLRTRVENAARAPVLLVASDFDGTLSPLVALPSLAAPEQRCIEALVALARLPHTHAAIVSGRAWNELLRLSGAPPGVALVGSHGAEYRSPGAEPAAARVLDRLADELTPFADTTRGFLLERKPFSVAFHYRAADAAEARARLDAIAAGPGATPGVRLIPGSMVLELAISDASKVGALNRLRREAGATSVVFLGDDPSDEDAIRSLLPSDLGIRVGSADTRAHGRTPDVSGVADTLALMLELRTQWIEQRDVPLITDHSILSDQRTIAVIDRRGSVVWASLPRIDAAALFASLVGGPPAGEFSISPERAPSERPAQHYDGHSFTLVTDWGSIRTRDYLDCSGGRAYQRAGRGDLVRVVEGGGTARIRFAPRLDYGRVSTHLRIHQGGLEVEGSPDPVVLYAPGVQWKLLDEGGHHTAEAIVEIGDEPLVLELRFGTGNLQPGVVPEAERAVSNRRFWEGWANTLRLPAVHPEAVRRSALVLKALSHGPTGAFAAAATTSLPEHLGGVRNWDYRYCWPRDASLMAASLVRLGNTGHALKLLDWILGVVDACESPERLHPIYTVTGGRLPPEAELGHLAGFGDSRPVRTSNAAAFQVQLDVFGPIVDLVARLADAGAPVAPDHWRLVRAMVTAVQARWQEPDHGIWEIRAERRHHVHSRVMCWVTVDRALRVEQHVLGRQNPDWIALRDAIRADIETNAWSDSLGAFRSAYGRDTLDAATLYVLLSGLLPPSDERVVRTVHAIDRHLRVGPAVYRYFDDDGLPGKEGGMLICSAWLAQAWHMIGEHARARELLDEIVALLGPTGMACEQYEPDYQLPLGNLAQGYTHLAIIDTALLLAGDARPAATREATGR
jgi:trehalose 6-phosphate phosphatase